MSEYVVYHRTCNHVAGICNDRTIAEYQIGLLAGMGRFGWRIRTGASDDDIRGFLRQDGCSECLITPREVPGVSPATPLQSEHWVVNGHQPNCAYLRSLDYVGEDEQECDCERDDEGFWDEDEES